MARVFAQMQQSIASGERVFSLLDAVPEVMDKPGALETAHLEGDILFDDVTFYYEKDKPVLRNFNLRVRPGDTIALVGPTGGGKSTIVNLLCRFYEPKDGRILFGEHDYTDLTQHAIQMCIRDSSEEMAVLNGISFRAVRDAIARELSLIHI